MASSDDKARGPSLARKLDMQMLLQHPSNQLLKVLLSHVEAVNQVDGLYHRQIVEQLGADVAEDLQIKVQRDLGAVEALKLIEALELSERNLMGLALALKHSSWMLAVEHKHFELADDQVRFAVQVCPWAQAGADPDAPCRAVRMAYLEGFVHTFNPAIRIEKLNGADFKKLGQDTLPGCAWSFVESEAVESEA